MKKVIDIHTHIGGPGDSGSGCRMSHEFTFSPAFGAMLIALQASINEAIDKGEIDPSHFLFGSDFPIPIIDINIFEKPGGLQELLELIKNRGNPLTLNETGFLAVTLTQDRRPFSWFEGALRAWGITSLHNQFPSLEKRG